MATCRSVQSVISCEHAWQLCVRRLYLLSGKPTASLYEGGALARTTVTLFKVWSLADAEACILLGGMSPRTWARWEDAQRLVWILMDHPEIVLGVLIIVFRFDLVSDTRFVASL
ncbi:hypothetical protein LJR231_002628 [Phyllobacterium sp. LjRoot231]|uniref:hypothetical protein n=1 Tax=Phyllobacterium sp. LjRoot231 TaxID=3342289 RepID=UPI003ECC6F04